MFLRKSPDIFFERYKQTPSIFEFFSQIEGDEQVFKLDNVASGVDQEVVDEVIIFKVPFFDRKYRGWIIGEVFEDDQSAIFVKKDDDLVITRFLFPGIPENDWSMGNLETFISNLS